VKNFSIAMSVILCLALLSGLPDFAYSEEKKRVGPKIGTKKSSESVQQKAQSEAQTGKAKKTSSNPKAQLNKELLEAVNKGDIKTVKRLLEKGASIEVRDKSLGGTPLIWAAFMGRESVVKLLLKKGADYNARNKKGWTALSLSCAKGHVNIAKQLLARGADIDARSKDGWTPLSIAFSKKNPKLLKLLAYYCAKSPWATVEVKRGDRKGCLTVRTHPSKKARTVKCIKKGERLGLTGIWTKGNWAQVCTPVKGWTVGRYIETRALPVRKRAVLAVKLKPNRASSARNPRQRRPAPMRRSREPIEDPDLRPNIPVRKHTWR
jgi:Ankyrin repeats (3 copies)/Ankyrin repeats (many copies)